MNFKGLLLSSAATVIAASAAHAADAVIAPEPEPVEYVRVCDTYGTGFFYIPGTETCLKIGGYWRYDVGVGDLFGQFGDEGDRTYSKRQRFQLRLDARSETELGTLRGYFAYNFNWLTSTSRSVVDTNGDGVPDTTVYDHDAGESDAINHAYVELGGFRVGVTDSLFTTETGFASNVVRDGLIPYGPFTTHQIAYTFDAGNGLSITGAVEEGRDGDSAYDEGQGAINDYTPHTLLGAAYSGGVFGVSAVGAYDANQEEFAAKARLDVKPNDMFSLMVMGAWTDDDDGNGGNYYATWGGDWAIWAGASAKFNDRVKANVEFGYNDFSDWSIDGDVNITVVPGFVVTPGVGFRHGDGDPLSAIPDGDNWGGYLRTQFTF